MFLELGRIKLLAIVLALYVNGLAHLVEAASQSHTDSLFQYLIFF